MKQMIIKVNDDYSQTVEGLSIHGQLVGSRSFYNKILVLAMSDLGMLEIGDKFEQLELDWEIIASEDEPLNADEFTNYMNDVGEESFSDLSTIQTFAGKRWTL